MIIVPLPSIHNQYFLCVTSNTGNKTNLNLSSLNQALLKAMGANPRLDSCSAAFTPLKTDSPDQYISSTRARAILVLQTSRIPHTIAFKTKLTVNHIHIHTEMHDKYTSSINQFTEAHQKRSNHFPSQRDNKEQAQQPNRQNDSILHTSF